MKCFKKLNAPEIVFQKWGRKNYSLFSILKKVVKISVLSVVYFLATPVVTLALEQDTSDVQMEYDLDEIEVSAKRTPAVYSEVARIVSVIDEKEIEAIPAQNIQDLLEYVAAVDVRQRGAQGVQADVSIRGGTFDQTLILLNGINITDPQTGHHNFNLPVNLEQVERIEILEGPAARVYGPNAFSGAINIITKAPGSQKGTARVSGGSFGYFDANASAGFRSGKLEHLLAAGRKRSDGYIENTDFSISNLFYSNRLKTESGKFSLQAGISGKAFGANSFYTPLFPEQFEQTRTLFSSAKWESFSPLHFSPVVYWRRHNVRFELFRNEAPGWYQNHNYHRTDVFGAGINSWFQWKWGRSAFGIEFRNENILSNVLGEEMPAPREVYGEDALFTKSKTRNTSSLFAEHAWYHHKWTITGGMMANYISESDRGVSVFPGVEVSYNPIPAVKLFGSYNTSLRMPTFTDLYYAGPTNVGNPHLKPEKSAAIEGGLRINNNYFQGHAVLFYRRGDDVIDWVKENQDD
ncbi:MAG: TonB-dependent receptor plug domain-containing protein, partial [Prolixibacteraceae bacterium]